MLIIYIYSTLVSFSRIKRLMLCAQSIVNYFKKVVKLQVSKSITKLFFSICLPYRILLKFSMGCFKYGLEQKYIRTNGGFFFCRVTTGFLISFQVLTKSASKDIYKIPKNDQPKCPLSCNLIDENGVLPLILSRTWTSSMVVFLEIRHE